MAKRHLRLVAPAAENRTVTPRRPPNKDLRTREYLTEDEIERLVRAIKDNRHGHRDATMVLVAFRHGLRAAELVDLGGSRSTSRRERCTSAGSSRARRARTRCAATNCGR